MQFIQAPSLIKEYVGIRIHYFALVGLEPCDIPVVKFVPMFTILRQRGVVTPVQAALVNDHREKIIGLLAASYLAALNHELAHIKAIYWEIYLCVSLLAN